VTLTAVEHLLATRIGFDIHTVGPDGVGAAVRKSMEEAGFSDPEAYARVLTIDPGAWNRLIDSVVIPETWFFRDVAPFELVANLARTHHLRGSSATALRILSCPCSTGEEPYSIVMSMLHAGAQAESFTVDAVDVSRRAVESAQSGVFRSRSFRDDARWYRVPYFDHPESDGSWRLKSSLVSMVKFQQGNLIAPDFLEKEASYDLVFCRNLLIYLHPGARLLAMAALRRLVSENGVLVLGHAEAAFAREHGFATTGPPSAFAFVKKHGSAILPKAPSSTRQDVRPVAPLRPWTLVRDTIPAAPVAPADVASVSPPETEPSLLESARQLGDAGQLHEALRVCREYLQLVPDSSEGHFLLGVLHDALGEVELAVSSFRKVLYLDPNHQEALLHLALKQEARGDGPGAALLRARARRAEDLSTTE
jgi:chemotaxis protein methyltransferase WspC